MFIQVIEGRTSDPEALRRQMDVWERELKPGAEGYLGSAGGCTADGSFIMAVRFSDRDAAMRNGESAPGARLTREFEIALIRTALAHTRGRRIEASHWLGWGRNTLTRKIHEYGLDDEV